MLSLQSVPPDSGSRKVQFGLLVSASQDEDVAAPADAGDGVAALQVLQVGVALDLADLAVCRCAC